MVKILKSFIGCFFLNLLGQFFLLMVPYSPLPVLMSVSAWLLILAAGLIFVRSVWRVIHSEKEVARDV